MKKLITLLFLFLTSFLFSQENYVLGKVIVKLSKNATPEKFVREFEQKNSSINILEISQVFHSSAKNFKQIYSTMFSSPIDVKALIPRLMKLKTVVWAEPDYVGKLAGITPNDPQFSSQWYLNKIQMPDAWEVEQGSGNLVVAVIDNGLNISHEDLQNQIWQNPNETLDGVDNDNNGYVDDIHGWDFGNNDNGIEHDGDSYHGSQVAGLIGAETNNNIGIASVGFNVKLMGLKITDNQSYTEVIMSAGYQAIVYAVDNGADVINCSWGNYQFSMLGYEAVQYAIAHNVIIVAAAGNDGINDVFYPAKYDGVLSVGATKDNDVIWEDSNYGYDIDLMAPGENVISTGGGNDYITASGTSLASPLVSGIAALVKKHFPDLNSLQVCERIRATADDIYSVNPNSEFMVGKGRVNAFSALSAEDVKSIRATNVTFTDNNDNVFLAGEEVEFYADFMNFLSAISNLQITVSTDDPYISLTTSSFSVSGISSNSDFNNQNSPFKFTLSNNVPENHTVHLRLDYSATDYSDFQWISVLVNPSYADMNVNNLDLTITSKGTLGYDDYPYNSKGNGLTYMNDAKTRFFEAGFLYGNSSDKVMDALHILQFSSVSNDFNTVSPFRVNVPGAIADQEGIVIFNDDNAGDNKLGIETTLNSFAFNTENDKNYIILKYSLKNIGSETINNLHVGLYFDWDLDEDDYADDYAAYDTVNNFGYAWDKDFNTISTYQGVALISDSAYNFWANYNDGSNGGINVENFTDDKKWTMLSSGLTQTSAENSDISFVVSGGPYSIEAGEEKAVVFAIAIAPDLNELTNAVSAAREKYFDVIVDVPTNENEKITNFELLQNYPNPFNPTTTINYVIANPDVIGVKQSIGNSAFANNSIDCRASLRSARNDRAVQVSLKIYDALGREVATLVNKEQAPGKYSVQLNAEKLPSGVYFYTLRAGNFVQTKKMVLMK